MSTTNLNQLFEKRRSIYHLGNKQILSEDEVIKLIEHAQKHCPTAFNSQSARLVVLYGNDYQKFWEITLAELKKIVPTEKFAPTHEKIKSFTIGIGTILYFEDLKTIENLQNKFPTYQDNFPVWAQQGNGILQYMIWIALADAGIGASIQHYNPLVDEEVYKTWNVPRTWKLIAQMPFGSIEAPADEKTFLSIDERIRVFG